MRTGDIVRFRSLDEDGKQNSCDAARFCARKKISGRLVTAGDKLKRFVVDAGLGYTIYALPEELDLVASHSEIPAVEDTEG